MKKRLLVAAVFAALALPAIGADAPREPKEPREPKLFDFDFKFDFELPAMDFLADAGSAAQHQAEFARAHVEQMREWAQNFAENMQGSMAYMFSDRVGRGKVVKGAPYSAEVVTESNQKLADGNVITHRKVSRVYRDGEGRTRQESVRDGKLRSVYISDPVAKANYTLLPDSKIALTTPRFETRIERSAPRAERERERTSERVERDAQGDRRITVRTIEDRDGGPGVREEVRVQVVRMGDGTSKEIVVPVPPVPPRPLVPGAAPVPPVPPLPPMPGVNTLRFESTSHLGKGATTNLGAKDFDGVKAEGKSTVWTIPAGQIGNRNPINVTSESWYSPDLQVTVYSRHDDPRTGESIYRLAAIKRAEPQPDLFKVPEDYQTKGRGKREEKPEAKR
jgi:hypothetical protein